MTRCDKSAVQQYRQIWLWLLLWIAFVPGAQAATDCNAVTEIPASECRSLLELYNSTNGPNWINNTGWNQTNTPCGWFGVTCRTEHVLALYLGSNQLSGNIPNFSNLPNLSGLLLNSNQLSGSIPNFSNLPNLLSLYLYENQLSDSIPDFSNLPNLSILSLYGNQLSGSIPNFSNLPNLSELLLYSNQLSGSIPNFSNLTNLSNLALINNKLSGSIPNFSNLPNLSNLVLSHNQLSGSVPNFSNLPNLAWLDLDQNQLSGSIPNFSNLRNLTGLVLWSNQLSGNIPNFSNLPNLRSLWLHNNQLSGPIPNFTAFSLANLEYAKFYNNCGLTAYDATQESILNSKDPNWQTRNSNCSVPENQPPIASFTVSPNSGTAPLNVQVNANSSSDPDGSITSYQWQTSNNLTANGISAFFDFAVAGSYTITLTIQDNQGAIASTSQTVTVNSQSVGMRTLILTNYQKLVELYGTSDADDLMTALNSLANHSDVQGQVIRVEDDPTVAAAYNSRGSRYDDKNRANAVAEAIKQVILDHWDNSDDALQYLVIAGDDRVIPFYRIIDGYKYDDYTPPDDWILTDDFYLDRQPIRNDCYGNDNCAVNPELFVPDVSSGRLLENPTQIIGVVETFLANQILSVDMAIVTGYALAPDGTEFLVDGAESHCNTLVNAGITTDCSLIGEEGTREEHIEKILNTYHDATSLNGHANYSVVGNLRATDFANTTTDFSRTIFYSVGCHAGQNVTDELDLPESLAIRRANYIANTGYGLGGTSGVNLSEELMSNLTQELVKSQTTLGKAFINAKQQYYADHPNFDPNDEKITAESTLYGLPMYQITSQATAAPIGTGITTTKTQTTQENGLQKDGYAYTWAMATPIATTSGNSFYSIRGTITSEDNKPILPKFTNEVTDPDKALHGIVFRGGNYKMVNATPPMQRFSTTTGHFTPEKKFTAPNWYPSVFFTPNALNLNTDKKEMLVATAGQYNPNLTTGQQRVFNNMDFDVYHHANANDWTPPTTYLTDHHLQANTATVTITTSDASGVKEVVIAYTDGNGTWNSANLTKNGETWAGNFAATTGTEFFVQAVDNSGNVAINDNEGKYFKFGNTLTLPMLDQNFTGGIAVNGQPHQSQAVVNLFDNVMVMGEMAVNAVDVGQTADIFVYAEATLSPSSTVHYFMLGEGLTISEWDRELEHLVSFISDVTLKEVQPILMYEGTFYYPGTLKIYFGYRLLDGTLVSNEQPIEVTIND